ncbi:acetyl-CoA acetyltransferase [Staphylococcus aureus M1423]|jgi:acetyl-CoA C-acetyltransferase|uniref:Probable acetyl-CoA acyltransferase n=12 Tax=Staphylococcus aureus TaxID=1280 RepID=THLA_STAAM|nr:MULTISPECIES: acetyl-CoA C-acetyltransferase [Staphylococcus]Q7A7L2.1 RecName: Full=Probable acetyl-CoA acyltransferase; AltName: Full=Acetoacetyl-CoA thiolase [Staphylococcus aureus subsp. aureus N315]Q99WM3.1 RecName: Full=Probable acetyl-CoA acyltransferase; AltName: Full=Acetoacetyl-CoA thiolase [Staphylococcus aureus subsp. aureus Mu50]EGL91594.1 acetyl-CoA C-acetyltransferase [Staphylococcus aureus subsp. aureus 21318]ENK69083.1 acetyl-CoA C-acetyltransferase [Staphylococcus aureus M05
MTRVVLAAAYRTPIGVFGGAFKDVPAYDLGATLIEHIIKETGLNPSEIDEVIIGNVLQAGQGQNPARIAAMKGGLPETVPAFTVNKVCGSGLKSIQLAYQSIVTGENDIVLAGGMENMSQSPMLVNNSRFGFKMGHQSMVDSMVYDGLTDVFNQYHMGITAENLVEQYGISREEQDTFAVNSQHKAVRAQQNGEFDSEIVPVSIPQRKGEPILVTKDEGVRENVSVEKLSRLRPAFKKDGTVTAGNASGINDGAAMMLVMSEDKAKELNIEPLAVLDGFGSHGVDPSIMGIAPVGAVEKALKRSKKELSDIDVFELNEAFAAQLLAVDRELKLPPEKVNVKGGAIALGHPIGASGARVLVTLLHQLNDEVETGLTSLCIGGGQAIAAVVSKYK